MNGPWDQARISSGGELYYINYNIENLIFPHSYYF